MSEQERAVCEKEREMRGNARDKGENGPLHPGRAIRLTVRDHRRALQRNERNGRESEREMREMKEV